MKLHSTRVRTGVLALVVAAVAVSGTAITASADTSTTPPWQTGSAVDPHEVGTLAFFDASGQQVFSGSVSDSPIAAYVVGSHEIESGDSVATLFAYTPVSGQASSGWSTGTQLTGGTTYPSSGAPASISSTLPVVTGQSGDTSLADQISAFPNASTASGYQGVYELRLRTTNPGHAQATGYDVADVLVSGDTWSVVYGSKITPTVTAKFSTTKPVYGKASTVAVTVASGDQSPTGSAQVAYGSKVLDTKALASGKATLTIPATALTPGSRKVVVSYLGSTSYAAAAAPATTLTVAKAAATITNKLSASSVKHTKSATLKVTVKATGVVPTGTVSVYDGSKKIKSGTLTAAKKGVITITLPKLKKGTHKIHAVYAGSTLVSSKTGATVTLKSK